MGAGASSTSAGTEGSESQSAGRVEPVTGSMPFADVALAMARAPRSANYVRSLRLRYFAVTSATTAVALALYFACYLAGYISSSVLVLAAGLALICLVVFGVVFQSGFNERFSDPSLTLPQVASAVTVTAYVMAHAGAARAPLALLLFTILVFAAFRFSWRLVLWLAAYVLACHAAAILIATGVEGRTPLWRADLMQWGFLVAMAPVLAWMASMQAEQRQRYRAGAALYRAIWNSSVDAIVIFDHLGAIRLANPAALKLFGHDAAALRGMVVSQLALPQQRKALERDLGQYLRTGDMARDWSGFEDIALTADGREVYVEAAVVELGGKGGREDLFEDGGRRLALFARDISQRRTMETIKDDFIATMSHELRTPLAVVIGAVEALQTASGQAASDATPAVQAPKVSGTVPASMAPAPGASTRDTQALLAMAAQGADRLNNLINTMLHLQKLDAGGIEFAPVILSATHLIDRAFETAEMNVQRAGRYLALARRAGSARVKADERWMHEVLVNLIDNAVKQSPEGATVVVGADVYDRCVRFSVVDQGCGVPPEFSGQVFARFGRAAVPEGRIQGGAGLGLSLCKAAVEGCGGVIGYQNNPGKGATFWFELPRVDL